MKPVNAILPRHIRQKLSTKPDDGVKGQKQCGDGAKNHRCPTFLLSSAPRAMHPPLRSVRRVCLKLGVSWHVLFQREEQEFS